MIRPASETQRTFDEFINMNQVAKLFRMIPDPLRLAEAKRYLSNITAVLNQISITAPAYTQVEPTKFKDPYGRLWRLWTVLHDLGTMDQTALHEVLTNPGNKQLLPKLRYQLTQLNDTVNMARIETRVEEHQYVVYG